jgi:hypothetical protein
VIPAHVESKRSEPHVPLAATFAAPAGMFNGFFMMGFKERDEHYVGCDDEIALWFFLYVMFAVVADGSIEDDFEKLIKDLGKTSTLEITTKAHEKLGDNITAQAFRYFLSLSLWIFFILIYQFQVVD